MPYVLLPYRTYRNAQITSANQSQRPTANLDYSYNNNLHQTPADTCSSVPLPDSDYLRTVSESASASDRTYFHSKPPHSYTGKLHLDEDVPHSSKYPINSSTTLYTVVPGSYSDGTSFPSRNPSIRLLAFLIAILTPSY